MIKLTVKREFSYPHRTIGEKTLLTAEPMNRKEFSVHFFAKR